MEALFEHFIDPRDPAFKDKDAWKSASTLGHTGRRYKTADQLYAEALDAEPYADGERREQLLAEAYKNERHNVAFYDVTFSVQKSITVLHAAFEHQEVAARRAGDERGRGGVGGAQASGGRRDLGRAAGRDRLPGRARRLLPGRAPRGRQRPVRRRARPGRRVVLPAHVAHE